jgi:3-phosphoshikimate 1-carboxyvinyltransferase
MDVEIAPGPSLKGAAEVPGDKSIAHRWLILAATGAGTSEIHGAPPSLDVRSTARCLTGIAPKARPSLDVFAKKGASAVEGAGSTWNDQVDLSPRTPLQVEGEGRRGLVGPAAPLDCGNSGTTMRLLAGVLASVPVHSVLTGDESLSRRPMERVARPLREMGARVSMSDGHAPIEVEGCPLRGITFAPEVPTAQVKSAVLLAGLSASGETIVREPARTRDHTERALQALGAPIAITPEEIRLAAFQHPGFAGAVPGDASSAAFLIAASAVTGSSLMIRNVGLNPSRVHFLAVMERMGVHTTCTVERTEVGEPVGSIEVEACEGIAPVIVEPSELPLVIDEVPVLAALAVHAAGDSWFNGAGELRVKESDRVAAIVEAIRGLGGAAADEGDDLVLAGGGLEGGRADAGGDHRIAMAMVVAALACRGPSVIQGVEAADVSYPGFVQALRRLGVLIEEV